MATCVQFFAFDVIGDLAFAEPFGCLEQSKHHPWIEFVFEAIIMQTMMRTLDYYPFFKRFSKMMISQAAQNGFKAHVAFIKEKATHRLDLQEDRADLMGKMAAKDSGTSREEFIASADTVLLGGSETSSTLLSGLTYYLLKNPRVLQKLVTEIRTKFQREEDIDFTGVNSLDYMLACIDEAFRLYPPVPGALLRKTREDDVICGQYVPPNVRLSLQLRGSNLSADFNPDHRRHLPLGYVPQPRLLRRRRRIHPRALDRNRRPFRQRQAQRCTALQLWPTELHWSQVSVSYRAASSFALHG